MQSIRFLNPRFRFRPRRLLIERCESRCCLTGGVGFEAHDLVTPDILDPIDVQAADFDLDGDADVLYADDQGVAWQENVDGKGVFGPRQNVSELPSRVEIGDLDGDGDPDLVVKPHDRAQGILWYENTDGLGSFSYGGIIDDAITIGALKTADVDFDGDADVVAVLSFSDQVVWYESDAGEFQRNEIRSSPTAEDDFLNLSLFVLDVDQDGHLDLIQSERQWGGVVGWSRNVDGNGDTWQWNAIGNLRLYVHAAGDLDGDGDVDLVGTDSDGLAWHETEGNRLGLGDRHLLAAGWNSWELERAGILVEDLDDDGDYDVLYGGGSQYGPWFLGWQENINNTAEFSDPLPISMRVMNPSSIGGTDFDGDGKLDVVASSLNDSNVGWFPSLGDGDYGPWKIVAQASAVGVHQVIPGDLDNDGDLDLLTISTAWGDYVRGPMSNVDAITWYENMDGELALGKPHVLANRDRDTLSVFPPMMRADAADLDEDGDLDVVAAFSNSIEWFENLGDGDFRNQVLSSELCPDSFGLNDMDADGDQDIVTFSRCSVDGRPLSTKLVWLENLGSGFASNFTVIPEGQDIRGLLFIGDVDSDGDADLVTEESNQVNLLTNNIGSFARTSLFPDEGTIHRVTVNDLDGDGDLDIVTGETRSEDFQFQHRLFWYENVDGLARGLEAGRVIDDKWCYSLEAGDLDADGDADVVCSVSLDVGTKRQLTWYEFDTSTKSFRNTHNVTPVEWLNTLMGQRNTTIVDLDEDGDLDLLTASIDDASIRWHENRLAGDVDDDSEVNMSDFLILAEHFGETDLNWVEGDLDDDGDVDFVDFLILSANFGATRE